MKFKYKSVNLLVIKEWSEHWYHQTFETEIDFHHFENFIFSMNLQKTNAG